MQFTPRTSQAKVKEAANWVAINTAKDPLLLWARIVVTHANGTDSTVLAIIQKKARDRYNRLTQQSSQTIANYKQSFDEAIAHLLAVGETAPRPAAQAADFITGLDNSRYSSFKSTIENNASANIADYPDTLVTAFARASEFKVITPQGAVVSAATFSIKKQAVPANVEKHLDTQPASDSPNKTQKQKPFRPCKHCGEMHWDSNCPKLLVKPAAEDLAPKEPAPVRKKSQAAVKEPESDDESITPPVRSPRVEKGNSCYMRSIIDSNGDLKPAPFNNNSGYLAPYF